MLKLEEVCLGDIVYFLCEHTSSYTNGYYYHKPDVPYKIIGVNYITCSIKNLEDNSNHFVFGELKDKLITLEEWRDIKLSNILGYLK